MGTQYCNSDDVKLVARSLSQDFGRNDPQLELEITAVINEASDKARTILAKQYTISVIDANIPPIVKDFTKTLAAILLLENRGQVSGLNTKDNTVDRLRKRLKYYKDQMISGNLVDDNGNAIATKVLSSSSNHIPSPFKEIWES